MAGLTNNPGFDKTSLSHTVPMNIGNLTRTDHNEQIIALMHKKIHKKDLSIEGRSIIILSPYYSTPLFLLEKINYNLHYNDVHLSEGCILRCLVLKTRPAN